MAEKKSNVVLADGARTVEHGGKWTGGIRNVPMDCPLEAAWELCSDWAHWQRWRPGPYVSEVREGENRKPGCLRYVEPKPGVLWIYERLLQVDNENFCLSYSMEDNVFCGGVKNYLAKVQFRRRSDGKALVEYWTYEVDPLQHMTREAFSSFMQVFLTDQLVKGLEAGARRLAAGLDPKPVAGDGTTTSTTTQT